MSHCEMDAADAILLLESGTIPFRVGHEDSDWATNEHSYAFARIQGAGVEVRSAKHPDKTLTVDVIGLFNQSFSFRHPTPPCINHGIYVIVTWGKREITLYLNGKPVERRLITPGEKP